MTSAQKTTGIHDSLAELLLRDRGIIYHQRSSDSSTLKGIKLAIKNDPDVSAEWIELQSQFQ